MSNESDWVDIPTTESDSDWVDVDSSQEQDYDWSSAPRDLIRTNIDALPMYGQAAGSLFGPIGSGLGQAAGNSLKEGINSLIDRPLSDNFRLPTKNHIAEVLDDSVKNFNEGVVYGMAGDIAAKGLQAGARGAQGLIANRAKALKGFYDRPPVENLDEILAASDRLGVKPLEAMKTSNKYVQDLESGLSQSGSIPARSVGEAYENFFAGLNKAGEKISSLATPDSDFAIGKALSEGLENQVRSSQAPVKELYDKVNPELFHIPVDESVVTKQFAALKRQPIFRTSDGSQFLQKYADDLLSSSKNLADLKEFRTNLKGSLSRTASDLDKTRLDAIYDAITRVRDGSINSVASVDDFISGAGKTIQKESGTLLDDIALADAAHASNMSEINSLGELIGNKGNLKSPSDFLNKLSQVSEDELTKRASNSSLNTLTNLKEKFPQIFEKARQAKVNEMIQKATGVNGFNEGQFIKNFDRLGREYQEMFFTPEQISHISDLKTIKAAIPERLGPSGTPKGLMTMDAWNPKRNIQDYLIKKSIQPDSSIPKILENIAMPSVNPLPQVAPTAGKVINFSKPLINEPIVPARAAEAPDNSAQTKPLIDKNDIMQRTAGSKYQQVLQNAAQKGDQSFNAAHYVLSTRDPEYRKRLGQ